MHTTAFAPNRVEGPSPGVGGPDTRPKHEASPKKPRTAVAELRIVAMQLAALMAFPVRSTHMLYSAPPSSSSMLSKKPPPRRGHVPQSVQSVPGVQYAGVSHWPLLANLQLLLSLSELPGTGVAVGTEIRSSPGPARDGAPE